MRNGMENLQSIAGPLSDTVLSLQGEGKAFPEVVEVVIRTWVIGLGEDPDSNIGEMLRNLITLSLKAKANYYYDMTECVEVEYAYPFWGINNHDLNQEIVALAEKGIIEIKKSKRSAGWEVRLSHTTNVYKQTKRK